MKAQVDLDLSPYTSLGGNQAKVHKATLGTRLERQLEGNPRSKLPCRNYSKSRQAGGGQ